MDQRDKTEYEIGYKKPPRRTQFRPGHSGNPRGRPKKSVTLADEFAKELESVYEFNVGGEVKKLPMRRVIAKKHVNKAAAGDAKSTALLLNALRPLESKQDDHVPELLGQFRAIHAFHKTAERTPHRSNASESGADTNKDDNAG